MYQVFGTASMLFLGYFSARHYEISKLNPINPKPAAKIRTVI
jgi:hypothetical protein